MMNSAHVYRYVNKKKTSFFPRFARKQVIEEERKIVVSSSRSSPALPTGNTLTRCSLQQQTRLSSSFNCLCI